MRAESAVEPTRSENITVTWRRSARSSGGALGALDVVAASTEGALPLASLRRAAMASSSFTPVPERCDAKLLQVLVRQARKNRLVYLVLAECRLILPEAQAPQPDHDVHLVPQTQGCSTSSCGPGRVSRRFQMGGFQCQSVSVSKQCHARPPRIGCQSGR